MLREQPPWPGDEGINFNDEHVRLELLTEFLQAPPPEITEVVMKGETDPALRQQMKEPDFKDQTLSFGTMLMADGAAFDLGDNQPDPANLGLRVGKHWQVVDGRQVLFEAVEVAEAAPALAKLPVRPQAGVKPKEKRVMVASRQALLPQTKPTAASGKKMLVAQNTPSNRGFALDYNVVSSSNNFQFFGDVTYYITNAVFLSGTTVIEGGTVVKLGRDSSSNRIYLQCSGPVICKTSAYRPAVFTAKDDDTCGEVLPTSTGSPTGVYGFYNLLINNAGVPVTLQYIHSRYAAIGLEVMYQSGHVFSHCQMIKCQIGALAGFGTAGQYPTLAVRNALIDQPSSAAFSGDTASITAENVTIGNAYSVLSQQSTNLCSLMLTNSIINGATYWTTDFTNASPGASFTSYTSGIFQSVGAGNYYLAANSPYRNVGTTAINAQLLADLKQKTTYSPILITNNISVATTFSPQAQRDTDLPDLGWTMMCWTTDSVK